MTIRRSTICFILPHECSPKTWLSFVGKSAVKRGVVSTLTRLRNALRSPSMPASCLGNAKRTKSEHLPDVQPWNFIFLNTNPRQTSPVLFTSRNNKLFQCPRSGLKRDSERTPRHPNRPFQRVLGLQFNRNWAMRLALTLVVLTEKRSVTITSDHDRASHHWHVGAFFWLLMLS